MSRHLTESVYVAGRFFAAGDVPDEEFADLITNPKVWDDYQPERAPRRPSALATTAVPSAGDAHGDRSGDTGSVSGGSDSVDLFDPATGGLDDVNNHLADADADEVRRVLALEAAGKQRKGILEGPYAPDEA